MATAEAVFNVHAVIVSFNPDIDVLNKCLAQLEPQVQKIYVVDNYSENIESVKGTTATYRTVELISLKINAGLGRAHNVGIKHAKDDGASHVLILDHDSIPSTRMVANMIDVLQDLNTKKKPIAAVGARYLGRHAGNESFFVQFGWAKFRRVFCSEGGKRYVRVDFLISSGSLISLASLNDIGEMDEGLFIDHIDTDWFLRANWRGYHSYGACDALMEHGLGEQTYRMWFGRWRYLPKHKPFRYYYIFRNSILLYKRSYAPMKWIINDIIRLLFIVAFYSLVSESRVEITKMIARGIVDGLRGITGERITPSKATC